MKKSNLFIALLSVAALTSLAGCNGNTSSPSISSDSTQTSANPDSITSVVINGPKTVNVGQTVTLVAGVTGDETNSVTWSSSDDTIATVSDSGVVTGVKAGSVTITATSVINPTVSGTWSLTVSAPTSKPTAITVSIDENEDVIFNSEKGLYEINANTVFNLKYVCDVPNPVPAFEVFYRVAESSVSSIAYSNYIDVDSKTGECRAIRAFSADTNSPYITLQVVYRLSISEEIIGSVNIDIIDNNLSLPSEIASTLETTLYAEMTRMTEISLSRKITKGTSISDVDANYRLFGNGSYVEVVDNEEETTSLYFNGNKDGNYYNLMYSPSISVISKSKEDLYSTNYQYAYDYQLDTSGLILNLMNNVIKGQTYFGLYAFNNDAIRSEIEVTEESNKTVLNASNSTEDAGEYTLSLELNFNDEKLLSSYKLSITNVYDGVTKSLNEEMSFTYSAAKASDDSGYEGKLDLSKYYIAQNFSIKNMEGESGDGFNFTNTENYVKFIPQEYEPTSETYDGKQYPVYEMTPDQSFAFAIDQTSLGNRDASLAIDNVTITTTPISTSGESAAEDICEVTAFEGGVYNISNNFDDLGNERLGEVLVTLTSTKGYTNSFIVRYNEYSDPTAIIVDAPNITQTDGEYYFDEVAVGDVSETFLLNSQPDTLAVDFALDVTDDKTGEKVTDALELYHYDNGNPDGKKGYGIKGLKEGSYTFTIHIVGYNNIKTPEMHIEIIPQLTEEEILNGITGERGYNYPGLTQGLGIETNFRFTKDKKLIITQTNTGVVYTDTIDFEIENGKIMLKGGTEGILDHEMPGGGYVEVEGTYLVLGEKATSGSYDGRNGPFVKYLRTDLPLSVARDFSTVRMYTGGQQDSYTGGVDIEKVSDPSEVNIQNYVYTSSAYSNGEFVDIKLTFKDDGTGEIVITDSNGVAYAPSTFEYTLASDSAEQYGYREYNITSFTAGTGKFAMIFTNVRYVDFYIADGHIQFNTTCSMQIKNNETNKTSYFFGSFIANKA